MAAPGWGSGPVWWGLRSSLPSLGSLGSRLSAADGRHLGEGEKSASGQGASVEPRAQTPTAAGLSHWGKSVERIEYNLLSAVAVAFENTLCGRFGLEISLNVLFPTSSDHFSIKSSYLSVKKSQIKNTRQLD